MSAKYRCGGRGSEPLADGHPDFSSGRRRRADLRDCLLIQLRRLGKENTLEYQIIHRFWMSSASGVFRRLRAGWV